MRHLAFIALSVTMLVFEYSASAFVIPEWKFETQLIGSDFIVEKKGERALDDYSLVRQTTNFRQFHHLTYDDLKLEYRLEQERCLAHSFNVAVSLRRPLAYMVDQFYKHRVSSIDLSVDRNSKDVQRKRERLAQAEKETNAWIDDILTSGQEFYVANSCSNTLPADFRSYVGYYTRLTVVNWRWTDMYIEVEAFQNISQLRDLYSLAGVTFGKLGNSNVNSSGIPLYDPKKTAHLLHQFINRR
jgi:hypothetical protein